MAEESGPISAPYEAGRGSTRGVRLVAAGLMIVLGYLAYGGWIRASERRWMRECQENLTKLDGVKEQWALENNKSPGTPFTREELHDYISTPKNCYPWEPPIECPSQCGEYVLTEVGTFPICTSGLPGHDFVGICLENPGLE